MNSMEWFRYTINDLEVGEIGLLAARAGARNIPVIAVAGDQMAALEAEKLLGRENVSCAVVKCGIGRNWADCLSIAEAYEAINRALENAVQKIGKVKPYRPKLPATVELTFYRSDFADRYNGRPEWERVDARTIRKTIDSFAESMW